MGESIQKRLGRGRPPRVQITYDVEVGDAIVKKELPFVMGIMADLAGDRTVREDLGLPPVPEYKLRTFAAVDRDNFDDNRCPRAQAFRAGPLHYRRRECGVAGRRR